MAPAVMAGLMEMMGRDLTATGGISLTPQQLVQAQWDIDHGGRISLYTFEVAIGVLFALAVLCFFGRISIRLMSPSRLARDDAFLTLAFVCLVGGTAVAFNRRNIIYLEFSVIRGDQLAEFVALDHLHDLLVEGSWQLAYLLFLWTTVFSVKWCYFAFFYRFLRPMSKKFIYYYWAAVSFSVISWLFMVIGEQLITCPYLGEKAAQKCSPNLPVSNAGLTTLFWICPALDGLTDAMIVAIPVLILRQSQMRLVTKIGVGLFLCLSMVMLSCSIIRAGGIHYHGALDFPWAVFWLHAEACIGVMMGSITVYRSTLVGDSSEVGDKLQSYLNKLLGRSSRHYNGATDDSEPKFEHDLNQSPVENRRASLPSFRTLFGHSSRTAPIQASVQTQESEIGLAETEYHNYMKAQADSRTANSSNDSRNATSP